MFNSFINFLNTHTPLLYFTQSLWRDEAFSVLISEPGGIASIKITAADYNPPLYYLILHYWMRIFGESEIAIRSLSFLFFIIFLIYFYKFSKLVFRGVWPYIAVIFACLNPMLLYYGFEARMYSLYSLTTTASMYYFYQKKWKHYIIATILAYYTHPYTLFLIVVQFTYLFIKQQLNRKTLTNLMIPLVIYLPWIVVIINQFKNSKEMWIYPINWNLITSVLGNLFINYEGTPGNLWFVTKIMTLVFLVLNIIGFRKKENRDKNLLFYLWLFVPLTIVIVISFIKPLFVNRYIIQVSIAQLFLLLLGVSSIHTKQIRTLIMSICFTGALFFLFYLPPYIKKVDIRTTFTEINKVAGPNDYVYAASPLNFFESMYYYKQRSKVFLYNPNMVRLPNYLGVILIPKNKQTNTFPKIPDKAFMVYENGSFELYSSFTNY